MSNMVKKNVYYLSRDEFWRMRMRFNAAQLNIQEAECRFWIRYQDGTVDEYVNKDCRLCNGLELVGERLEPVGETEGRG